MILVSACLLGVHSKYDGSNNNTCNLLLEYAKAGRVIPVCPEQLGGLTTPRDPAEIEGGTGREVLLNKAIVRNASGVDVTEPFVVGAREVLRIAELFPIKAAILKERSPSCGVSQQYDGTFTGTLIDGMGVCAALLKEHGIPIYSEKQISKEMLNKLLSR